MKKCLFSITILIMSGCAQQDLMDQSVTDYDNGINNSEEMIVESRAEGHQLLTNMQQVTDRNTTLSTEEAEEIVRKELNLTNSFQVEYYGNEDGHYLVQVFEMKDEGMNTEHALTRAWYYVNPKTGLVKRK